MSGPIVRTGTTPKFWKNWENIFGDKKAAKTETGKAKAPKAAAKATDAKKSTKAKAAAPAKAAKAAKAKKK